MAKRTSKSQRSKKVNICPICKKKYKSIKKYITHTESHHLSNEKNKCSRIEVILLGITTSALWKFIEWSIPKIPYDQLLDIMKEFIQSCYPTGLFSQSKEREDIIKGIEDFSEDEASLFKDVFIERMKILNTNNDFAIELFIEWSEEDSAI